VTGEELVQLAKEAGIDYTEAELQTAFKHDWVMRKHAVACRQTSLRYRLTETVTRVVNGGGTTVL